MAAGSALSLVAAAIYLSLSVLAPPVSGEGATLESVPDLVKAMYLNIENFPCVRLLNLSGEIGCSNPGSEKIIAPIVRFRKSSDQLVQSSTVLLPLDQMPDFFLRVSNDQEFHQKVSGVLIESNGVNSNLQELSPDRKFPQEAFSPYSNRSHDWNPAGSGIMWNRYDFPVFLLSEESTQTLRKVSEKNKKTDNGYKANVAEFDLIMQVQCHVPDKAKANPALSSEGTCEEKVFNIFRHPNVTHGAVIIGSVSNMPTREHCFRVEPVHHHKPDEKFNPCCALCSPDYLVDRVYLS